MGAAAHSSGLLRASHSAWLFDPMSTALEQAEVKANRQHQLDLMRPSPATTVPRDRGLSLIY